MSVIMLKNEQYEYLNVKLQEKLNNEVKTGSGTFAYQVVRFDWAIGKRVEGDQEVHDTAELVSRAWPAAY